MNYDKLIRDGIPKLLELKGISFTYHKASETEYIRKLKEKLQEEVAEYLEDPVIDELVDILEVIYAIAETHRHSHEQLEAARKAKAEIRGTFTKRYILEQTD